MKSLGTRLSFSSAAAAVLLLLLLLLRCHRVSLVLVRVARAPRAQFWSMDAADEEQPTRTSGGNEELICEEAASSTAVAAARLPPRFGLLRHH